MKNIIALICILIGLVACKNDLIVNSSEKENSLQEQLALLDGQNTSNNQIEHIESLLHNLSRIYNEPTDSIAVWTRQTRGKIQDQGIQVTNVHILEEINQAGNIAKISYKDAATLYMLIQTKVL